MDLKERIQLLCKQNQVSMNKLETDLKFGKGYISKLGKSTPNVTKLQKIADYFGVSTDYLMTGKKDIDLRVDGLTGFQALLADIYGSCKLESVMGEYSECLYFSVGTGKSRYALEETDFDRLYNSVKKNRSTDDQLAFKK